MEVIKVIIVYFLKEKILKCYIYIFYVGLYIYVICVFLLYFIYKNYIKIWIIYMYVVI